MKKISIYLTCFMISLSFNLVSSNAASRQKFKATKLPDGWYTALSAVAVDYSDTGMEDDFAVVKSIKLKKIRNKYYAVINGQLDYSHRNQGKILRRYKNAKRTIQLSKKCIYEEQEEPKSHFYSRNRMFKYLPGIETRIHIKKHLIVRIITSA